MIHSDFLFLLDSDLVSYIFLEIHLFLLDCPVCWHRIIHNSLSWSFAFLCCNVSPFISDFIFLKFLFFWSSLAKNLSILFVFSKNPLVLLIFYIVFLVQILFIYVMIFVISFLLLTLSLVCPFSSSLRCQMKLFIWRFLVFFFLFVLLYTFISFPFRIAFAISHRFYMWFFFVCFKIASSFIFDSFFAPDQEHVP